MPEGHLVALKPDGPERTADAKNVMFIYQIRQVQNVLLTWGKLGQVLLLLGSIPKKQNTLKADRLVGTQSNTNAQVMNANDLNQSSILQDQLMESCYTRCNRTIMLQTWHNIL